MFHNTEKPVPVRSVRKALDLLSILAFEEPDGEGMSLSQLARRMGLPANSTRNLLKTMIICGFVAQNEQGMYITGPRCRQIGNLNRITSPEALSVLRPALVALSERLQESVIFAILSGANRIILVDVDTDEAVTVNKSVYREGFYWTTTGRVLLAFASEDQVKQVLAVHGMPGEQWSGIRNEASLQKALSAVRTAGCSVVAPNAKGVVAMACPVLDGSGGLLGSLGCHAPMFRCPKTRQEKIIKEMERTAELLGKRL